MRPRAATTGFQSIVESSVSPPRETEGGFFVSTRRAFLVGAGSVLTLPIVSSLAIEPDLAKTRVEDETTYLHRFDHVHTQHTIRIDCEQRIWEIGNIEIEFAFSQC